MRTSQQLYNQIRWDPRFSPQEYVLGIRARRSQAIEELPITEFVPNGDIPWHRILYIKGPSGVVWDRSNRLDRLQPGLPRWGGAEQAAMQQLGPAQELDSLNILTYNCCAGRNGLPLENRLRGLLNIIGRADYDLVALQEVGPEFLLELESYFEEQDENNPYAWLGGEHPSQLLLLSRLPVANDRYVELSPGKWALIAELQTFSVATVHFTSNYRAESSALRSAQWSVLQGELKGRPWLALGDFNGDDAEVQAWLQSSLHGATTTAGIVEAGPSGVTFDPPNNPWAAQNSPSGRAVRYDRVFLSSALSVHYAVMETAILRESPASDHYPLMVRLQRQHSPALTHLSALSILIPNRIASLVQPIRIEHDPAYPRWMPHLNVVYPAPAQLDLHHLQRCLADFDAFPLRFNSLDVFEHAHSSIIYLRPDGPSTARMLELRERLLAALGKSKIKTSEFTPHMTVARHKGPRAELEAQIRVWTRKVGQPEFTVQSVAWLGRQADTNFAIAESLRLRVRGTWQVAFDELARVCQQGSVSPGRLEVVGSSVWIEGRDLDAVWVEPGGDGEATKSAVVEHYPGTRRIGQMLRLPSQHIDLMTASGPDAEDTSWLAVADARALAAFVGRKALEEEFQVALQLLLDWAELRQIKGQAYGFPGGLAWAVMLARFLEAGGDVRGQLAEWDWTQPIGLFPHKSKTRSPMTVLAPSPPRRNLTRNVTPSTLAILTREFRLNAAESVTPQAPYLCLQGTSDVELVGAMKGRALGLIVDIEKKMGIPVRPYPGRSIEAGWAWYLGLPEACDFARALELARANLPSGAGVELVQ